MIVLGLQGEPNPIRANAHDLPSEWSSGWFHDAAAVLMEDGRVVAAVEEERLTRRKHMGKFPVHAIRHCLRERGITLDDVDAIAYGEQGGIGAFLLPDLSRERVARVLAQELGAGEAILDKLRLVEHHLCHVMSAWGPSGYDEALVMTADGFGDGKAGYFVSVRDGKLEVLDHTAVDDSLGMFYNFPLEFLGYPDHSEYKVMGLAPYGDASRFRAFFREQYELLPQGRWRLRPYAEMQARIHRLGAPRRPGGAFEQHHKDVAAALQESFEEIVFHAVRHYRDATGHRHLCVAGGAFQNSTLNGKLAASGLFDGVFVQPASYDAGVALGAAMYVAHEQGHRPAPLEHLFWGPEPGDPAPRLAAWSEYLTWERHDDICTVAASLLAQGAVIGWVQGRSEFGPRALGNRSILADARPSSNKDLVNLMVKKREAYRPFAPAVLREAAADYFAVPPAACCDYMTFVTSVHEPRRALLGATTHVDGSARVQTVSKETSPMFWRLIRAFDELTGVPVLLNTSFNNNYEPIVDSVDDAVECFLTTGLHYLVVGDYLVRKRELGAAAYRRLHAALPPDRLLVRGTERNGHATAKTFGAIVAGGKTPIPVSEAMFRVLESSLAGAPAEPAADDDAWADELRRLWETRTITVRPRA